MALALVVIVGAVVAAADWPALHSTAVFQDDDEYLLGNGLVLNPSLESARIFFSEVLNPSTVRGYYQPLTMVSLMLDCAMGGSPDNLLPFRRTNLILHVANAALVTVLLLLLFTKPVPAALAGLLYGLHPLTVDSVVWVTERKTLLAAFLSMVSLVLYVLHTRRGTRTTLVASLASYGLALLAKPIALMLPFLLLILDWWPLQRFNRRAMAEKVPFLLLTVMGALVTVLSQSQAAGVTPVLVQTPLIVSYGNLFYLSHAIWPAGLSSFYPVPDPLSWSNPTLLWSLIGSLVLVGLLALSLRRTRALVVGWLFFLIAVLPTLGVLSITQVIVANRYAYLPLVGLVLPVAALLAHLVGPSDGGSWRARVALVTGVVLVVAVGELVVTRVQLGYWSSTESHYRHMVSVSPNVALLHNNLGMELARLGRREEAMDCYRNAIALDPGFVQAYNNLAVGHYRLGQREAAAAMWQRALEVPHDPTVRYAQVHYNLGWVMFERGDYQGAASALKQAVDLEPRWLLARRKLADALVHLGDAAGALEHLQYVLQFERDPDLHCNVGALLQSLGRRDEAAREFQEALEIDPGHARAQQLIRSLSDSPSG